MKSYDELKGEMESIRKQMIEIKKKERIDSYNKMLAFPDTKQRFTEIYNRNLWSSKESSSGEGSEVAYTESLRAWMICNLPRLGIKKLVDAPCGDFNWMRLVLPNLDINYIGLDVVDSIIVTNNHKYASDKIFFKAANICADEIPSCDLVMVRDCLFHLSYDDIAKFFRNLENTEYKYLLTTTHIVEQGFENSDITTGAFRMIDLFNKPFSFDMKCIKDRVADYPPGFRVKREMILIEKKFVPKNLSVF